MRKVLISVLLSLVPLTGFRVVCVTVPDAVPPAAVDGAPHDGCADMCELRSPEKKGTRCALAPDGTTVVLAGGVAVMPSPISCGAPASVTVLYLPDLTSRYPDPGLDGTDPPPEG